MAAVAFDRLAQHTIVARERGWHRFRMLLPQLRAARDVGEQEGDRPAGERWSRFRRSLRSAIERLRGDGELVGGQLRTPGTDERSALVRRDLEDIGQALGHLA